MSSSLHRNPTEVPTCKILAKMYALRKRTHGGDRKSQNFNENQMCQNGTFDFEADSTLEEMAKEAGVSMKTMYNKIRIGMLEDCLAEKYETKELTQAQAIQLSFAPRDMQQAIVEQLYSSTDKGWMTDDLAKAIGSEAKKQLKAGSELNQGQLDQIVKRVKGESKNLPKVEKDGKYLTPQDVFPKGLKKKERAKFVAAAWNYIKEKNLINEIEKYMRELEHNLDKDVERE